MGPYDGPNRRIGERARVAACSMHDSTAIVDSVKCTTRHKLLWFRLHSDDMGVRRQAFFLLARI